MEYLVYISSSLTDPALLILDWRRNERGGKVTANVCIEGTLGSAAFFSTPDYFFFINQSSTLELRAPVRLVMTASPFSEMELQPAIKRSRAKSALCVKFPLRFLAQSVKEGRRGAAVGVTFGWMFTTKACRLKMITVLPAKSVLTLKLSCFICC